MHFRKSICLENWSDEGRKRNYKDLARVCVVQGKGRLGKKKVSIGDPETKVASVQGAAED